MSGSDGVSCSVPIPSDVRKTIQDIREITGKQHTDDEIYSYLRECSMDPDDTAQKLLYLDTFHEGSCSKALEDSRLKQGGQGRRGKGASAGYYSSSLSDGGGGRNVASRRENGVNHSAERGHESSTWPVSQKPKNNTKSQATRVSAVASGPANQSDGSSSHGTADQSVIGSDSMSASKSSSAVDDTNNVENVQLQAAVAAASSPLKISGLVTCIDHGKSLSSSDQLPTSASSASVFGVYSSSSDPELAPSISQSPGINGAIDREVGSQNISVADLPSSKNGKSGSMKSISKTKAPNKLKEVEKNHFSETSLLSSSLPCNGSLMSSSSCGSQPPPANASEASEACVQCTAESRQHVTFPNHFQVPETLKSGLTFGSFDNLGPRERSSGGTGGDNNNSASLESSPANDETVISGNPRASLSAQGDHAEHAHSASYPVEKTSALGNSVTVSDSKDDLPKQEVLLAPEGPPIPNVHNAQNYGLNFTSTVLGTQQVRTEGAESQAYEISQLPNFISASSEALSSPSPTPALQSSIPVFPQSVSLFRPPHHPNFFPYGYYYPPFYVSLMHQFMSHNGFPQQPSAGNMYLPASAAGIKFPLPQFKAGANTGIGNTAHFGIPSGSFVTPPVGYASTPAVNPGSSTGNEDLVVSQVKENHIYTTGQLSEGSAVWIPALGQDISSLQVNSMYNLTPQGHLTFPPAQTSHGAFAGIYQPAPTVVSPSTLLQQSQAVVGPPSSASAAASACTDQLEF